MLCMILLFVCLIVGKLSFKIRLSLNSLTFCFFCCLLLQFLHFRYFDYWVTLSFTISIDCVEELVFFKPLESREFFLSLFIASNFCHCIILMLSKCYIYNSIVGKYISFSTQTMLEVITKASILYSYFLSYIRG